MAPLKSRRKVGLGPGPKCGERGPDLALPGGARGRAPRTQMRGLSICRRTLRPSWLALVLAVIPGCAPETDDHLGHYPPETDFSFGCRTLCCKEKGAACDGGTGVCDECATRCEGACTSARPLLSCLDEVARVRLVCQPDGSVAPETDACAEKLAAYQEATRACGRPQAAVGGR